MGLVLDTSVLIAAERGKSPVSVMELEHGWHRANTPEVALKRRRYLDEVLAVIPVESFTREMAVLAAKVDAGMRKDGLVIATADLLIGVTALFHGYGVGTRNVRHFPIGNLRLGVRVQTPRQFIDRFRQTP